MSIVPRSTILAWLLLPLMLVVMACGGGGAGGPQPGSDEWHDEEAAKASAKAKAGLNDALAKVDRCSPTPEQLTAVFDAMGRTQALGTATGAEERATAAALQPSVRAVARAHARGDATGMTPQTITNLADWTGLDTSGTAWMEDPSCDWVVTVRVLSISAVPGVTGKLEMNGRVPLRTNVVTSELSGTGRLEVMGEMQSPPPCSATYQPAATDSSIRGKERAGKLALSISYAAYTLVGQLTCDTPAGRVSLPTPIPMQAMQDFAMSVEARDGATAADERASVTVTVTRAK